MTGRSQNSLLFCFWIETFLWLPCETGRICLAESELTHQGSAFLFCLTLNLAGDFGIKNHLSLQVWAGPDPQCGSLHLTPALFSESSFNWNVHWCQRSLEEKLLLSNIAAEPAWKLRQWRLLKDSGTPEDEWEGGNQKLWFLIPSRPAHIAVADAPLLCSMVELPFCCFIFTSSPGYNVKQGWFGLWAASELSVSCNGCVVPWSLAADIAGAIEMVYRGGITAPRPRPQKGSVLVLTRTMSHSGLMVTLSPGQYEIELILLWEWGLTAPECGWAMEKLSDVREGRGFSTKDKSSAGL